MESSRHSFFLILLVLASFSALFIDAAAYLGGYADQRFLLCALLVALPVALFFFHKEFLNSPNKISFVVVVGLTIFTLSVTVSWLSVEKMSEFAAVEALFHVFYLAGVASVATIIMFSQNRLILLKRVVLILLLGSIAYALTTPAIYFFAINDGVKKLDNFLPWGFVNIRYWSHVASWLLPLLPLATLVNPFRQSALWSIIVGFAAAIWWWLLIMSSSRGSMVGLALAALLVVLLFGKSALPWLKVYIKHIGLGVVAWVFLSVMIPGWLIEDSQMRNLGSGSSGRLPLWGEAWQMSLQHFPFGMGPQSWLTHEILTEGYAQSRSFGHPHNMYLMWAAEFGWLAVAGLGIIACGGFVRLLKRKRELAQRSVLDHERLLLMGLTGSVVAGLVHAGVSAVFMAPASMLLGLFILGAFWAVISPKQAWIKRPLVETGSHSINPARRLVLAVVMFSLMGIWFKGVIDYYEAMEADLPFYHEHVRENHQPRFWFHGNFPRHASQMPGSEFNE